MIVIPPGGGEVVGDSPQRRVEIVSDHPSLSATVARMAAGGEGAGLHVHRHHSDIFYVLAGELTVRLGLEDEQLRVRAGSLARVPPMVVHGFRNAGAEEMRYVNLHAPGMRFADYMRGLRDGRPVVYDQEPPPAFGARPASDAVAGVAGEGVLVDVPEIRIAEVIRRGGETPEAGDGDALRSLFVLDGELEMAAAEREIEAAAGTWIQVEAGTPHTLAFPGPVRYLDIRT